MELLDSATEIGLVAAVLALAAVIGVRLVNKAGLPALLLFIVIGLLLGPHGAGIAFDDAQLATVFGYLALIIILAEGGLTSRSTLIKPVMGPAVALASVGVVVSIAIVGAALHFLLGMAWIPSLLIGASLAPTDAAAVFTVVRGLRLPGRLRSLLEVESGFNDAPVIVLITILIESAGSAGGQSWWMAPLVVIGELVGGSIIGVMVGYAARWLLPRLALPAAGLYPVAVVSLIGIAYGVAALAHCSGFIAVYISAVMMSSAALPHKRSVVGFVEGLAWAVQLGMFVMLGLLADLDGLSEALGPAVVAGVALVLLGRPLGVLISLLPFSRENAFTRAVGAIPIPMSWQLFVSWAGLRGAVPMIFATIPLGAGLESGPLVFAVILIIVVVLTLVQSPTIPGLSRRLGLEVLEEAGEVDVDSAPLDDLGGSLLSIEVPRFSGLAGAYVKELALPQHAVVSLVLRDGDTIVPDAHTRIRRGDRLLIVTTEEDKAQAERAVRAISRSGRLAAWYGERGLEQ